MITIIIVLYGLIAAATALLVHVAEEDMGTRLHSSTVFFAALLWPITWSLAITERFWGPTLARHTEKAQLRESVNRDQFEQARDQARAEMDKWVAEDPENRRYREILTKRGVEFHVTKGDKETEPFVTHGSDTETLADAGTDSPEFQAAMQRSRDAFNERYGHLFADEIRPVDRLKKQEPKLRKPLSTPEEREEALKRLTKRAKEGQFVIESSDGERSYHTEEETRRILTSGNTDKAVREARERPSNEWSGQVQDPRVGSDPGWYETTDPEDREDFWNGSA